MNNKHRVIAAAVVLSAMAGHAQTPTFRTETTVVQLPVRVLDSRGNFVMDLTDADIEVREDGVPQKISEFTLVDLSSVPAPSPLTVPASGVLSAADLEKVPGRLYVFLLDDVHVGVGHSARARDLIKGIHSRSPDGRRRGGRRRGERRCASGFYARQSGAAASGGSV